MADIARIKRNVAKMVSMNAPESDIDAYIASEGVSLDDVRNFRADVPQSTPEQDAVAERFRREASAATQNPARGQYEALPAWQKPIVAASDILQLGVNGATMGFGDKLAAAARAPFTDKTYAQELVAQRGLTRAARNRAGSAGTVAEIGGAVATPVALAGRGLTLAGRGGTAAMTGAKGLAARSGLMGLEGAGYGALTATGNDQDIRTGALIGMGAGVGGNLIGESIAAGVGKIAGKFNPKAATPTVDEIKSASRVAYHRAENAGVAFNNKGVNKLRSDIVQDLTARGFDPINEPGVMPVINRLKAMGRGNVTFKGLDTLRKVASNGYRPGMKSNNEAIGQIINRIDELVNAADPSMILMGKNPKAAAAALNEARSHWHRALKLETVEKAITRGEQNAAAQVSGDVGRTTMGQLKRILQSEAKTRGFTPAEMKALGSAAGYSTGQRVAHAVGGLMPRGRLLSSIHGAVALGTGGASIPLQAAGAAVGYGAQKTAEALARKSVAELTRLIANGGVPAPVVQNVVQLLTASKREALSRALTAIGVNRGNAWYNEPRHHDQP